jgi:CubicO group peptidase (beta-lactamase class C family)
MRWAEINLTLTSKADISNPEIRHERLAMKALTAAILLLSLGFDSSGQSISPTARQIEALVREFHERGQFNGSMLVAKNGTVIFKKGLGLASREWNTPNQSDTKFQIASLTKQFTAMIVMQLVEQGKISLDGKISDYLSDYPKDKGSRVTIRNLLSHTSGIPNYTDLPNWSAISRQPHTPDQFIKVFADLNLEFEPGSKFKYSNSGYYLLGVIIERVTGKSFGKVLREKILSPLNMRNTGYPSSKTVVSNLAAGYERLPAGLYEKAPYQDLSTAFSEGGMYSTVEDLYLWDRGLYSDKLLSAKYKDILFNQNLANYAFGWVVGKASVAEARSFLNNPFLFSSVETAQRQKLLTWHWGSNPGFNAIILRSVDDKGVIIILDNSELIGEAKGTKVFDLAAGIVEILYGKK